MFFLIFKQIGNQEFDPSTQHQISILVNTLKRSTEESTMLQKEMLSLLQCLSEEHLQLGQKLPDCPSLKQAMLIMISQDKILHNYFRARKLFDGWIQLPPVPNHLQVTEEPTIDLDGDVEFQEVSSDAEWCVDDDDEDDEEDFDFDI